MNPSIWDKLGRLSTQTLYLSLVIVVVLLLQIANCKVPDVPQEAAIDLYAALSKIPPGKTILVQTDWTNSTRGENKGQFTAMLRILSRRNIKFFMYSAGDPQAPQVARNVIQEINKERALDHLPPYEPGRDFVDAGFFPNAEGVGVAMKTNIRSAFANSKTRTPGGQEVNIWKCDVLKDYNKLADFPIIVCVTASNTIDIMVERLGGQIPIGLMCTGVMGPQMIPYYKSGQITGISNGLRGVLDLETLMESGLRGEAVAITDANKGYAVSKKSPDILVEPLKGKNLDQGNRNMVALQGALTLMILLVVVGNIGMIAARRKGN